MGQVRMWEQKPSPTWCDFLTPTDPLLFFCRSFLAVLSVNTLIQSLSLRTPTVCVFGEEALWLSLENLKLSEFGLRVARAHNFLYCPVGFFVGLWARVFCPPSGNLALGFKPLPSVQCRSLQFCFESGSQVTQNARLLHNPFPCDRPQGCVINLTSSPDRELP